MDRRGSLQPALPVSMHPQSSLLEHSTDYAVDQIYPVLHSLSDLKDVSLDSELHAEVQSRNEVFFDIQEQQSEEIIDTEKLCGCSETEAREASAAMRTCELEEDSQQEYHSAEEQDCVCCPLTSRQTEEQSFPDLQAIGLSLGCVKCANILEDDCVDSENCFCLSLDSSDSYRQDSRCVSRPQSTAELREYRELKHRGHKEPEVRAQYQALFAKVPPKSSALKSQECQSVSSFSKPLGALKTKISAGSLQPQVTEGQDFCGDTADEDRTSLPLEDCNILLQDRVSDALLQPCREDGQASWASTLNGSSSSTSELSQYRSLQSTPQPALHTPVSPPESWARDGQQGQGDSPPEAAQGRATAPAYFCLKDMPGHRAAVTVSQAVDVSSDFRACFTTSRATNTGGSVTSTSSNTEITMMSKERPGERHCGRQRSVACNTEQLLGRGDGEAPRLVSKGPSGKPLSASNLQAGGSSDKGSLASRGTLDSTALQKRPKGECRLPEDEEEALPSACCQRLMQRAVKAESHLLNVHYDLCYRHCRDIHRLIVESRGTADTWDLSSSAKKELGSVLLSIWGDIKARYVSWREKMSRGLALDELPPLSIEARLLSAFSDFVSKLVQEDSTDFTGINSGLDCPRPHDGDGDFSSRKKTFSQISVTSDNSNSKQNLTPKEEDFKNADADVTLSPLKLEEKGCKRGDVSENWFDAKESLTGTDFLGTHQGPVAAGTTGPKPAPEEKSGGALWGEKSHLIHVGGLCPSVSEADLRSSFQKYHICEISICGSPTDYRYASLTLKGEDDARTAVADMNGVEVKGKVVSVRLVRSPGERGQKSTSQGADSTSSISRLPRARPRQRSLEQDGELCPQEQGVKKTCKQIESAKLLPDIPTHFIPPDTLNLRSFTKIMRRLAELHPEVSREHIVGALQEVRLSHAGFLNGLPINTIVEMTSSVLKSSTSS